jgi:GMP synthase (glutamine-hydrolysing)
VPDTDPLLVIQHQENCPPALFAQWLRASGLDLDVRRPDRGDALPTDLAAHSGLLVLGGSMNAHEDATYPWLPITKGLLVHAIEAGRPMLGICLGHQLACVALGAQSRPNPRGRTLGARPIGWRAGAVDDPLCRDLFADPDALVPHWNTDAVLALPEGVDLLAATADGAAQIVRLGAMAWGVQFHPEVDHALVCEWAEEDRSASAERSDGRAARDQAAPDRSVSAERSDGRAARDQAAPDRSVSAERSDGRAARDRAAPDRSVSAERSDGRAARDQAAPDRSARAPQEGGAGPGVDLEDALQQLKDNEQELLRTGRIFAESFARIVREERL